MDSIFLWLMGGVAGLLLVAAGVAGWEHLRRSVRPQDEFAKATPRAVKIDLRLDRLAAQAAVAQPGAAAPAAAAAAAQVTTPAAAPVQPLSEMDQRRAALDEVLARLAQPPGGDGHDSPRLWAETTPMVAPGQLDPHEPTAVRRPPEFSASQQ